MDNLHVINGSSLIKQTQLNVNNSHPGVSSKLLIEDEEPNPTSTPNLAYKYNLAQFLAYTHVLQRCQPFKGVSIKLNCLNISILESLVSLHL